MTRRATALPADYHPSLLHGSLQLPSVNVRDYSLELRERGGFLGDQVSRKAFSAMLDDWRTLFREMDDGEDPFGKKPTPELGKARLDRLLDTPTPAGAALDAAIEDYAVQLAHVVRRFLRHPSWRGVERIVVGGGFQQSKVGHRAVRRAARLLADQGLKIKLRTLHHHSDEGGLVGWVHLAPPELLENYNALLAVDIGGTNVRCGIVRTRQHKAANLSLADVIGRSKWGHADDDEATRREHLVHGIAEMLETLIRKAKKKKLVLAPFVGVACPGTILEDGSLANGTQNLPGNWEGAGFHLPQRLCERLPRIDRHETQVRMHNDAVVQGLSELPHMRDVKRWAVLTVGTGLGNASYVNHKPRKS
ncbi:MAG: ROK family protein [Polaromonas sp.]|nr:ROK family protein [Polaromonas sp.]